ncbi:MAG: hypothetical protein JEY99_04230 [Spirochaetales bacterium]|nr:hypothetical protein [Spirochaetales bacterium]
MKPSIYKAALFKLLLGALIAASFFSCQMEQRVTIDKEGEGELTFSIELADYLTTVVEQMQALGGTPETEEEAGIVEIEALKTDLNQRPELEVTALENSDDQHWNGTIEFTDIESILASSELPPGTENLFVFSRKPGSSLLELNVSLESIEAILAANPSLDSPLMQAFGPLANIGLTDEDYLEMMEFALGPESREGIKGSALDMVIQVDGRIISQTGGELIDNSTVRFSIPLLDILIIEDSINYSVKFN